MDIDLLSKMVKELILDNDRVVLPGLGCFVAETVPAYFSDKGYTINPPYRKLYFRARPDEGDALVLFYARSNDVSYEVADRIIKDFVAELKSVLHVKKAVVFPGLGRLRATKENNVFFIADEDLDIYPEGFGLEPISLKTHQETAEEVSAAVYGLKSVLETVPVPEIAPVQEEPIVTPEPVEEPEPESVIEVEPVAEPEPEFEFLVEPMPDDESEPFEEPETVAEPELLATPLAEPEAAPAPEPVDEPVVEPVAEPVVELVPVPGPEVPAAVQTPAPDPVKPKGNKLVKALLIVLTILAVVVIAYMLVGRLCPEWIDRFLYTPEELEIIKH